MEAIASQGQCYSHVSLGQPFPSTAIPKRHTLGRKKSPRKRVLVNHALKIRNQFGNRFGRGNVKAEEDEDIIETTESEPTSGTRKIFNFPIPSKSKGTVKLQNKGQSLRKSNKVVFVAGATGKVGSRTVRELLKLGYSVRASTRNVEKAQALFEDIEQKSSTGSTESDNAPFGFLSLFGFSKPSKSGKRLEIVECDLEDSESIEAALGNAGIVVCCIGASEKEVLDISGPYRIDFKATENLINAASSSEVSHFVLVTSLGTQKLGFPAAVLNLFWGVLVWKAKAEKALIQSGLPYTIVRPGGMERPTDAYKETHNLVLAEADKLFGGQVSNLQVAELLASIVENPDVSVNKIIEAVAETTAPLRPIRELLEEIPSEDIAAPKTLSTNVLKASKKQEEERMVNEKFTQAQKEKEEKRLQAEKNEQEKVRLQALRQKYEEEIEAAKEKEESAKTAAEAALAEKAELENRAAEIRAQAEAAALAASQAKAVEAAVLAAAKKGEVLSDDEKQKIMESVKLAKVSKETTAIQSPKSKPTPKKEPLFSFLGRTSPPTTAIREESLTDAMEEQLVPDVKPKVKAKTVKEPDRKQAEQKLKKEQIPTEVAEAKKKEEQEKKDAEAEQKAAAEAERKAAAEAELKAAEVAKQKEEELAEAKKKEEEEKMKKLEAEALAKKKEEEEKAKKVTEEKEAITSSAAEVLDEKPNEETATAPSNKGFRWFWQTPEPETSTEDETSALTVDPKVIEEEEANVSVQTAETDVLPPCPTPLSPYTCYPGLKPPTPPTASASAAKAEIEMAPKADPVRTEVGSVRQPTPKAEAQSQEPVTITETPFELEPEMDIEARKQQTLETQQREKEALEKAQTAVVFKWPWQKSETIMDDDTSASIEKDSIVAEMPASMVSKEVDQSQGKSDELPRSSRPLSPYTQYPGLKPPRPSKASPPAPQNGTAVETLPLSSTPLSPYAGFPDLKPPTSPGPSTGDGPAAEEKEEAEEPALSSGFKWPWQQ
ncbi:hypothetical protein KP509_1Z144700 [Ceratopteris richardii]|nr:hypothetical protein KP509_1Z144700 [Ceratopteris richardii]